MFDFTKVEALSNDFIIIEKNKFNIKKYDIQKICDRYTGIGADGVILYEDNNVLFINSDGSFASTCGNGLRCFARYYYLKTKQEKFVVKVGNNDIFIEILDDESILVNMGTFKILNTYFINVGKQNIKAVEVDLTNKHLVLFFKDIIKIDLKKYVNLINKKLKDINIEFIKLKSKESIDMRVWERGVGETKACGSGAAASLIASNYLGLTSNFIDIEMPGGVLVSYIKDSNVYIKGSANIVYTGRSCF